MENICPNALFLIFWWFYQERVYARPQISAVRLARARAVCRKWRDCNVHALWMELCIKESPMLGRVMEIRLELGQHTTWHDLYFQMRKCYWNYETMKARIDDMIDSEDCVFRSEEIHDGEELKREKYLLGIDVFLLAKGTRSHLQTFFLGLGHYEDDDKSCFVHYCVPEAEQWKYRVKNNEELPTVKTTVYLIRKEDWGMIQIGRGVEKTEFFSNGDEPDHEELGGHVHFNFEVRDMVPEDNIHNDGIFMDAMFSEKVETTVDNDKVFTLSEIDFKLLSNCQCKLPTEYDDFILSMIIKYNHAIVSPVMARPRAARE